MITRVGNHRLVIMSHVVIKSILSFETLSTDIACAGVALGSGRFTVLGLVGWSMGGTRAISSYDWFSDQYTWVQLISFGCADLIMCFKCVYLQAIYVVENFSTKYTRKLGWVTMCLRNVGLQSLVSLKAILTQAAGTDFCIETPDIMTYAL